MATGIKNVEEALDLILSKMQAKDLLPPGCDKDALKKSVLDHIEKNEIDTSDLDFNNDNTKKLLVGVVISTMLGVKDDEFTKELKSGDPKEPNEKLDKKLAAGVAVVGTILALQMDQKSKDLINDLIKPHVAKSPSPNPEMKQQPDKDSVELEKELTSLIDKQISDTYRSLYGGDDPRITGEIVGPVVGVILGNVTAFTNQSAADPKATSFMVETITYNPGKVDYTGIENSEKLSDLMSSMHPSPSLTAK